MRVRTPILASLIVLVTVLAIPLTTHPAAAVPGKAVDDPGNVWAPYGPYAPGQAGLTDSLLLRYYADPTSEFNDFVAGKLDVTDWPQSTAGFPSFDSNPDFQLSPTQGQFGDFGIYFNAADNVFTNTTGYAAAGLDAADSGGPWWGCDWNTGAVGTVYRQTYVTPCGIEMRQAFIHLVDRPVFSRPLPAQPLADPSPPAKDPSASSLAEQCSWDTIPAGTNIAGHIVPSSCISAYNYGVDPSGFATPGSIDFCMAAQHMINAGIAASLNSDCSIASINTTNVPGGLGQLTSHPIKGLIRNGDPRRFRLGLGFMGALDALFGGAAVVAPSFHQFLGVIVFDEYPEGATADWSFYTYGYALGGPFPDHMYDLYSTENADSYCGGPFNPEPDNPTFVCLGQTVSSAPACSIGSGCTFEQAIVAASQATDLPTFRAAILDAFHEYGRHAVDMATYSIGIRIAALTSVAGLVNQRGTSYTNIYTLLNASKDPNYTPANTLYQFGGGDPSTLRWGQAQVVTSLNIFHAQTVWEFQALGEIYDTLFQASPVELSKVFCWMCNVDANNGFLGPTPKIDPVTGNTHFLVELKNNLYWQDGVKVDAYDVAFSLIALAHSPGAGGEVNPLQRVTVLNPRSLDIELEGSSLGLPIGLTNVFIIPRHIWECTTDNTCAASISPFHEKYVAAGVLDPSIIKQSLNYDPVANGALVGSGPFTCVSLSGPDASRVGTGCIMDSSGARYDHQNIPVGGTMLLQSYDFARNPGNTNPYYQYMRSVDSNWGTGSSFVAAQSGEFNEFKYADFDHSAQVDSSDIAKIAVCVGATGPADPTHAICTGEPGDGYTYWARTAFETTPGTIGGEFAVVQGQFGANYVAPFAWNSASLENIAAYP